MNAPPPLSLTGARWALGVPDPARMAAASQRGLLPTAAAVLALRGFDTDLLDPPSLDDLLDPYAMTHMDTAIARLHQAARDREHLRVITDYDVDGTTSSLILQAALRLHAPDLLIDHHIPDRFAEGYGFSVAAANKAAADGVRLIVTADIGVRDHAAVQAAREAGVDVLICDHHLPEGAAVPEGATVLCPPQQACSYPNPHLAACGVSLKLAQALLHDHPKRDAVVRSLLKLAAIGTVADLVPLRTRENRAIVALGLAELNRGPHSAGLAALLEAAGLTLGSIGADDLGFRVGPRINAAGRLAHAGHVVELLTSRDPHRARQLAHELDALNQERRQVQAALADRAEAMAGNDPDDFVVVAGPEADGWHRGVVGIVAARLKERFHRPVAVAAIADGMAVGSVRSIGAVHAVEALASAEDLLVKFGGHPAAAGFTVPEEHLDALRERLGAFVARTTTPDDRIRTRSVDAHVSADALDQQLMAQLAELGPFGMGNPEPRLLVPGVTLSGVRTMGKTAAHVQARMGSRGTRIVWWGGAQHAGALAAGPVDLIGSLKVNEWRGRRNLELLVRDARPAVDP